MAAEPQGSRPQRASAVPPPAASGLLDRITATSLDEDYAHVSRRRSRAGETRPTGRSPGRPAFVVLVVFGVLVAIAGLQTARTATQSASSRASLVAQVDQRRARLLTQQATLRALQRQVQTLQSSSLATTGRLRKVEQRLSRLGVLTGGAPTRGPGIRVVVDDARAAVSNEQRVQAPDLQKLVNGLWQVGAEAVSINGQRLTALSSIRDAGSAVTVNYVSLRRPYRVLAIGDSKTMGARLLDTAGGAIWVTLQSTFGLQFDVTNEDSMLLPAAKRITLRSARPAPTGASTAPGAPG